MLISTLIRLTIITLSLSLFNFASAETGVTSSSITFGMSSPFTGINGAYGLAMKEVIESYFQQINASGGVNGRKFVLVALDDGYETERTIANTKALIQQHKVFSLVGYYGSSPTTAAMQVFSADKVPLVGTISGADTLRNPVNRYMFNVRASYANETEAIITLLTSLGLKNIAVLYQNDGFGKSGLEGVTKALKKSGLTPSAIASVERNSVDVAPAVATIAKVHPHAVVMVSLYKPTAAFVKQMKAAGSHTLFATLSPVSADLLVAELGADSRGISISQVMPYPWNTTVPVVREYKYLMQRDNKKHTLSYYGMEGYITAKVLVEAVKKAGKDITREKLVNALEEMRELDLGGYKLNFSPTDHNGSKFVDLTVIGPGGSVMR